MRVLYIFMIVGRLYFSAISKSRLYLYCICSSRCKKNMGRLRIYEVLPFVNLLFLFYFFFLFCCLCEHMRTSLWKHLFLFQARVNTVPQQYSFQIF